MKKLLVLILLATATLTQAKNIYVAPAGSDAAAGTIDSPLATLPAAYKKVVSGDTVYFRGGTYKVTDEQVMKYKSPYVYVFALEKAGTASKQITFPSGCPQHYIHHCLAYRNKSNGIYSNHHLGGNRWEYNTSGMNQRHNYSMVNRKGTATTDNVDVDGYDHILIGNVSWKGNRGDVTALDTERCTLTNNSFGPDAFTVADADFVTVSPSSFFASRDAEGNLPEILFLVGKQGRKLTQLQMGYAWEEETNGIEQAVIHKVNEPCDIYNLQGQRVQQMQRGKMYIVNGKKIFLR